jgi:hypothetical protein
LYCWLTMFLIKACFWRTYMRKSFNWLGHQPDPRHAQINLDAFSFPTGCQGWVEQTAISLFPPVEVPNQELFLPICPSGSKYWRYIVARGFLIWNSRPSVYITKP